jgi:hypothetical protein
MELTKVEAVSRDILCALLSGPKGASLNLVNSGDDFIVYSVAMAQGLLLRAATADFKVAGQQPPTEQSAPVAEADMQS